MTAVQALHAVTASFRKRVLADVLHHVGRSLQRKDKKPVNAGLCLGSSGRRPVKEVRRKSICPVIVYKVAHSVYKSVTEVPVLRREGVVRLVPAPVVCDKQPPEGICGDRIYPSAAGALSDSEFKVFLNAAVIAENGFYGEHLRVGIAYPDKPVALDAVPYRPVLHIQMAGIDRRIVDLIDKRIAAPEAAPVFCIGIDKVGNRCLQVKKPVAVGQLYLHEPEAGLTEGEVGIKRQDCIEIARRMVVARTLFPDLRKSLAYRLTEGKPYVNVSASFGEGSEKPYAAVQFLPEIKDDKGVFFLPAVVKHSNVRLAESYLELFPAKQLLRPGHLSRCHDNACGKHEFVYSFVFSDYFQILGCCHLCCSFHSASMQKREFADNTHRHPPITVLYHIIRAFSTPLQKLGQ